MNKATRALAKKLDECSDEELMLRIRARLGMAELEARYLQSRGFLVGFSASRARHPDHPQGIPKLSAEMVQKSTRRT